MTIRGHHHVFVRAFTLIELMVSAGVVAILVGLVVPSLHQSVATARLTVMSGTVRQNYIAINAYADSNKEVLPTHPASILASLNNYWRVLVREGHFSSVHEVDPLGIRRWNIVSIGLSLTMAGPPEYFTIEGYSHMDAVPVVGARRPLVRYPSEKGQISQVHNPDHGDTLGTFWTQTGDAGWTAPIASCDGGIRLGRWSDYGIEPVRLDTWIGHPVVSTWYGYLGRDRKR